VHDGFNLAARIAGMIALAIGFGSVGSLVCACVYMVHETALALDNLAEEANTVMLESAQHPPQR
jgi:hypothetical protein